MATRRSVGSATIAHGSPSAAAPATTAAAAAGTSFSVAMTATVMACASITPRRVRMPISAAISVGATIGPAPSLSLPVSSPGSTPAPLSR
jgi:hypothetical protein